MRKIAFYLLATASIFTACQNASFKKGDDGMEYKIINDGKGDTLKQGQFMELHFTSVLSGAGKKDSVLNSSRDQGGPQIMPFDSASLPPAYYKIFKLLRKGDSVATRTSTDTIIKKQPGGNLPPFIKKGMFIYTNIKLINVYKTSAEADSAKKINATAAEAVAKAKAEALVKADDKTISDYLAKNNIKTTKTEKGVYVQTLQAGTGTLLDTNVFVKIKYTGKTLDGKIFDTNIDSSKGHMEPLKVNLTNDMALGNGVIPGMTDALKTMQKGTKAKMFIPSGLAYGARGAGADIPANANLIFEVEVLDVISKEVAKAENDALQKKQMEQQKAMQAVQMAAQKKYLDSLKKADPKKAAEIEQQMMQQQMQQQMQQRRGGR